MVDNPDCETQRLGTVLWSVETLASLVDPRGEVSPPRILVVPSIPLGPIVTPRVVSQLQSSKRRCFVGTFSNATKRLFADASFKDAYAATNRVQNNRVAAKILAFKVASCNRVPKSERRRGEKKVCVCVCDS